MSLVEQYQALEDIYAGLYLKVAKKSFALACQSILPGISNFGNSYVIDQIEAVVELARKDGVI